MPPLQTRERKAAEVREREDGYRRQLDECGKLLDQQKEASAALDSTREALQGSEAVLAATRSLVSEHELRLDEQDGALREALGRNDAAMTERGELQAQLAAVVQMQAAAEAQVADAHGDNERLRARVQGLVEDGSASAAQAEVGAENAAQAQEELTRLRQKVRGLELELEHAQALATLVEQRQGAEHERREAVGKIEEQRERLEALQLELERSREARSEEERDRERDRDEQRPLAIEPPAAPMSPGLPSLFQGMMGQLLPNTPSCMMRSRSPPKPSLREVKSPLSRALGSPRAEGKSPPPGRRRRDTRGSEAPQVHEDAHVSPHVDTHNGHDSPQRRRGSPSRSRRQPSAPAAGSGGRSHSRRERGDAQPQAHALPVKALEYPD